MIYVLVVGTLACEWQTFLLAHRRWGTFRETSLSGEELGETSAVRRLSVLVLLVELAEAERDS